ncbi:MAG: ABC transporter substrate-binding protein [Pseudomonadales bacterium]|jgi:NitT/TauT family transport system substrate-binding protein|nr:ABC transporter substrate-binding protein [Pseudomonadales bacterium]MCP5332868.1 ABC transporter substrate-binding protein [Pseudomonadales bacterium]HMZ90857.1 ABC transporter substrate-binding protein [Pseudomonadales bacterium]HNC75994.1 ABC transporter substrate-binding protein [Pseudomonadales bacterium]HNF07703.1 ABC transporter substrate-binding protein [Pseudomonadales bacterium]
MRRLLRTLLLTLSLGGLAPVHADEAESVTLAIQNGIAYLPLLLADEQHLIEEEAARLGLPNLKVKLLNLGSAGMIRDALIAGQVDFGAVGPPTLVNMHDKTRGDIKLVSVIVSLPMTLNTTNDRVKSICQFDTGDKIALPTIKISVQAVTLQMAAKAQCGDPFLLDRLTVSMAHPDGMNALLSGVVSAHFTSPPFAQAEIERGQGKVRPLLDSYSILGDKSTFIVLVGSERFRARNPNLHAAVRSAIQRAKARIAQDGTAAAQLYLRRENSRETLDEVLKQLDSTDLEFGEVPRGIGHYARFMHEVGSVKGRYDWKALSMPELHDQPGS